MANRVNLRKLKHRVEKVRVTASIDMQAYEGLLALMELEPSASISKIIGDALRFAKANGMYMGRDAVIQIIGAPVAAEKVRSSGLVDKPSWCEKFGGTCDGINCTYKKYEVTAGGDVVRNEITVPLRGMPDNEVDFRKSVLGGFITVHEAEVAFESQVEEVFFDPSEIKRNRGKIEE